MNMIWRATASSPPGGKDLDNSAPDSDAVAHFLLSPADRK